LRFDEAEKSAKINCYSVKGLGGKRPKGKCRKKKILKE
jgi:hypothetical protein